MKHQILQIEIRDHSNLSGPACEKVFRTLALAPTCVVVPCDVICAATPPWPWPAFRPSTLRELVDTLAAVEQFDWATFFVFQCGVPNYLPESFEAYFGAADIVIRGVDDELFIVYTDSDGPLPELSLAFGESNVSATWCKLDEIKHPF
jgi:hypothetical protein